MMDSEPNVANSMRTGVSCNGPNNELRIMQQMAGFERIRYGNNPACQAVLHWTA